MVSFDFGWGTESKLIGKLQLEVTQLREEADSIKLSRSEISNDILEDARARLQMLQNSVSQILR